MITDKFYLYFTVAIASCLPSDGGSKNQFNLISEKMLIVWSKTKLGLACREYEHLIQKCILI